MSYIDNSGIEHEDYEAACIYYGADTPDQIAYEMAELAHEEWIETQDRIEARGPVFFVASNEIPF